MDTPLIYFFKKAIGQLIEYYPRYCLLCQKKTKHQYLICKDCFSFLPFIRQACSICRTKLQDIANVCGQCLKESYAFDQVITPFHYEKPITKLLFQLKFYEQLSSICCFTYFLVREIKQKRIPMPQLIIPVPLHKNRLKQRGYNQALELAKSLSRVLNIPIDNRCRRIKETRAQQTLTIKARLKNVKNAFCYAQPLNYSSVAIIDDIMTTGATVNELAKCLKKKGINTIQVWCCART